MTASAVAVPIRSRATNLFRDRPIVPLVGLLVLLVIIIELADPGIVTPG